ESFHKRLRFTPLKTHHQLLRSIGIITIAWVVITLVTRPTNQRKLRQFCVKIKPSEKLGLYKYL
ncbi:MAG: hypothetical protein MJA30_09445, partial [Cytophagales bacterium]|nr:hypothetical protein [Cytophagales bacterium]